MHVLALKYLVHVSKYDRRRRAFSIFLARHLHLLDTIYVLYILHVSVAQRAGQAAKMHRENLPPEGVSLTECTPDAAGFIAGERGVFAPCGVLVPPVDNEIRFRSQDQRVYCTKLTQSCRRRSAVPFLQCRQPHSTNDFLFYQVLSSRPVAKHHITTPCFLRPPHNGTPRLGLNVVRCG